ncbi:hypothetical protein PVAND_015441 [Polypedilum vanderplanki]|uniref:G-protein coupled receptors family 2 profile 2 domain-containing protein n=1 Tax=Polypedilum vanderplanki TaxID=319348 RepID=A0A9J6BCL3_POLVA|nr:hypothetical protein PVAND_015441 [Polypedilum vanderplanki]
MKSNKIFNILSLVLLIIIVTTAILLIFKDSLKHKLREIEICNSESCIRFCCPKTASCQDEKQFNISEIKEAEQLDKNYEVIKGLPCENFHVLDDFQFLKDGKVQDSENFTYDWTEYCYHLSENDNDNNMVLTCVPISVIESAKEIYPWLMLSSVIFLVLTLVYYRFYKQIKIKHGNFIMSYVLSLIFMYLVLSMIGLFNSQLLENHTKTCKAFGYLFTTFIYMCFFWLSAMCFDVWFTVKNAKNGLETKVKFYRYCLFAFGIPIVVVLLVFILNETGVIPHGWQTNIGNHSCGISEPLFDVSNEAILHSQRAQLIYLYGPISLILLINFGFYAATFFTLYRERNKYEADDQYHRLITEREISRLNLYAWFCLFMTIIWTIEILSWLIDDSPFLYVLSIINCLQGFIIFFMFAYREEKIVTAAPSRNNVEMEVEGSKGQTNGYLIDAENHVYNWNEYCYFHTQDFILTCVPVNIIENLKTIFPYLMLSSVPFLIITLFIYGFISELRTNHGKCIMGYVSSLILMYTSLSIIGIENHNLLQNHNKTCKSLGYIFMSSIWMCFFWLNVMCFDVWNSIRSSTPASAQCRNSTKTFIKYCLYAFGVPDLISFVIILLNELEVISEDWQTGIGKYSCSISEPIYDNSDEAYERSLRAQKLYLYGPISFFLFINIGFYITTAYTIFDIQNQTNAFNKDGNRKHTKKEKGRFALYIRLFLLMGLPWSIEILSWLFESEVTYIVSIINCMQGVVIFVMFVMHKRILQYLKKKKNPTFNTQSTALRPLKSRIQSKESLA